MGVYRQVVNVPGTAANVTGVVAVANGGTGQNTAALAFAAIRQYAQTSDSGVVRLSLAGEATNRANDSTVLTPKSLRDALNAQNDAPIFAARAWVNFNGTGTVAIRAAGNVSSITDTGTGSYTINLTTPLATNNFSVALTRSGNGFIRSGAFAPGSLTTLTTAANSGGSIGTVAEDVPDVTAAFYL